jgi:hypothetical protein
MRASRYNPGKLTTNCGFCSIAHGLFVQKGVVVDADQLYLQTLERLGLTREGNQDPIPRQLIFPEPNMDDIPLTTTYGALADRGFGPSGYTITAVALASGLEFQLRDRDLTLPRQFMDFSARTGPGNWNINEFVQMRLDWLRTRRLNPSPEAVQHHIMEELGGHSIMGSKTVNHFINVHVDTLGRITAFDAQDGSDYDGRELYTRLRSVDLFLHLR